MYVAFLVPARKSMRRALAPAALGELAPSRRAPLGEAHLACVRAALCAGVSGAV